MIVVLAVLLIGADRLVWWIARDAIATKWENLGAEEGTVRLSGFPFLNQAVTGHLQELELTAAGIERGENKIENLDLRMNGVDFSVLQRQIRSAETLDMRMRIPVNNLGAGELGNLQISDGTIHASTTVSGMSMTMDVEVSPGEPDAEGYPTLMLEPKNLQLPDAGLLGLMMAQVQIPAQSVSLTQVPPGLTVENVKLTEQGLQLRLAGSNVQLDGVL